MASAHRVSNAGRGSWIGLKSPRWVCDARGAGSLLCVSSIGSTGILGAGCETCCGPIRPLWTRGARRGAAGTVLYSGALGGTSAQAQDTQREQEAQDDHWHPPLQTAYHIRLAGCQGTMRSLVLLLMASAASSLTTGQYYNGNGRERGVPRRQLRPLLFGRVQFGLWGAEPREVYELHRAPGRISVGE